MGGGICAYDASVVINSSLISGNTIISEKTPTGDGAGGGVYSNRNLTATDCVFAGNTVTYTYWGTAGSTNIKNHGGGGVFFTGNYTFTATSCTFTANTASITATGSPDSFTGNGGGAVLIGVNSGNPTVEITGGSFTGNTVTGNDNGGGAIICPNAYSGVVSPNALYPGNSNTSNVGAKNAQLY